MSKDLYFEGDPVTILDDGDFVGKDWHIKAHKNMGHGFIKVYAPWCGHCQGKVECIKRLGKILSEYGVGVYVLNLDNCRVFQKHYGDRISGYPTFLEVDQDGGIGAPMTNSMGEQVYTVPDIIAALCGNDGDICKIAKEFNDCS